MEMAKVTSKGQITIPVSIRRRLGISEGDKLLFIDRPEGVMMVNPDMLGERDEDGPAPEARSSELREKVTAESSTAESQALKQTHSGEKEKPAPQVQGVDLNALLNEIRSIGSNV